MFKTITPEEAGVSSASVAKYIGLLQKRGVRIHGLLMLKDGKIFCEEYWKPFHKDFQHRMYSQTKSFVGVAIGLLEEEGKLSLDDKIVDYFPEKMDGEVQEHHKTQTIRDMLTMSTAGGPSSWFVSGDPDRTHQYFNEKRALHTPGTLWAYDSPGSQVLCSLVEKLSGKTLLAYMKEKLFNEMGAFQNAIVLQAPNGDSWGDSAMICTPRDMAAFGLFVMNYGVWNGKRLMNEKYLREATSKIVDNRMDGYYSVYYQGYGYQFWRVDGNGFACVGMGNQLTICYPDKGLILVTTADSQGVTVERELIIGAFEDIIVDECADSALPANEAAQEKLKAVTADLRLYEIKGLEDSPFRKELNAQEYVCEENPMGITKFSFVFHDEKTGEFRYTNAQGDKVIPFGVNHNVFGKFPQLGYSRERGAVPTTDGFMYDDAVSFAWLEENKIMLYVQIIDQYFGNLSATFAFKGDAVHARFSKVAEFFLGEYQGGLTAYKANK